MTERSLNLFVFAAIALTLLSMITTWTRRGLDNNQSRGNNHGNTPTNENHGEYDNHQPREIIDQRLSAVGLRYLPLPGLFQTRLVALPPV